MDELNIDNMSREALLTCIRKHVRFLEIRLFSLRKFRLLIQQCSTTLAIFKFQNYEAFCSKLTDLQDTDLVLLANVTSSLYRNQLLIGPKLFGYIKLGDAFTNQVFSDVLSNAQNMLSDNINNDFSTHFPDLLTPQQLSQKDSSLILTKIDRIDSNKVRLWFCNRKIVRYKDEFIINQTTASVQEFFTTRNYNLDDSFVAFKEDYKQHFHIIEVDLNNKEFLIYVDATGLSSQIDYKNQMSNLHNICVVLLGSHVRNVVTKLTPLNLLLKKLYEEPAGRLLSFSHYTASGSVKVEKLDNKNKHRDLREEEFHKKGMEGINQRTEFHEVEKTWECSNVAMIPIFNPTLKLAFTSYLHNKTRSSACLLGRIDDCADSTDMVNIVNKIKTL